MKLSILPAVWLLWALPAWSQDAPPSGFPWEAHDPHSIVLPGVDHPVYKQRYSLAVAGQVVQRTRVERASTSADWRSEEGEFSVSYFFTCWTGREGGDVIYLCGMKATGESIIERWTFPVPNGRWVVRYPGATPAIGTPAMAYSPVVAVKGGGVWRWSNGNFQQGSLTPPIPPQPSASPQISILYEGSDGPFSSMAVDPEGRQLLLYDFQEKAIQRLRLAPLGTSLETLYGAQAHPVLDQVGSLDVRDFAAEGRKLLIRRQYAQTFVGSAEVFTIASDPDNDGNFDGLVSYDRTAFEGSPYRNWPQWKEFWRLGD